MHTISMMILFAGFIMGLSLIVAIGPQNAMIIKQGIRKEHLTLILIVCALSDVILIFSGTAGVGLLVDRHPELLMVMKYLGAAYLSYFAFTCFRDGIRRRGNSTVEETAPATPEEVGTFDGTSRGGSLLTRTRSKQRIATRTWVKPLLTAMALTWLNPAAYIDTVVMVGSVANQYGESGRWIFATGAIAASFTWFPLIGYLATRYCHVLARPRVWSMLNIAIGVMMAALTMKLLLL